MKKDNVIQEKSYAFAVRVVRVCQYLVEEKRELVLSNQLLRSGTSIGANVEEAIGGQSERDFVAKLSVAYKEARESKYWVRLLGDTDYLTQKQLESLLADLEQVLKLLGTILRRMKEKGTQRSC